MKPMDMSVRCRESGRRGTACWALASMLSLAACGGGGGGEAGGGGGGAGGSTLSIGGTAATGAPIAGATVNAVCASGSGSATTSSSGRFDIAIADGASPCVLRVVAGGNALFSLVPSGSGAATANLTPLADLIVARAHGGDPAALFATFDAAAQAQLTPAAVNAAQADVIAALKPAIDLSGMNPIADDASIGGSLDQKLDAFTALLAARGVALADLVSAIEAGSTAAATRLLQPAASTCDALRSGGVRLVAGKGLHGVTQFDATTLGYVLPDGTPGTLTDNGACSFSTPGGDTVLFGKSGFIAVDTAAAGGNPSRLLLGVPDQSIQMSELAGTWNYVAYVAINPASPALSPRTGTFTLDAAGKASAFVICVNLDPCSDAGTLPDLAVAPDGGFQRTDGNGTDFYYAFKTETGRYTMVGFLTETGFGYVVATKQVARTLPAVGDVTKLRSFTVDNQAMASAITDSTYTVLSVDSAAQSFTRQRQQDGRMETLEINSPRSGLVHRQPGAAPAIISMPLAGNAATVYVSADTAHNFLGVSVQHP